MPVFRKFLCSHFPLDRTEKAALLLPVVPVQQRTSSQNTRARGGSVLVGNESPIRMQRDCWRIIRSTLWSALIRAFDRLNCVPLPTA
jgi:hypothetical protein